MNIAELQEITTITEAPVNKDPFAHLNGYKRIPRALKKRNKKYLYAPSSLQKGYKIMSQYFGI
jgi:hypothetical protein